ncbi:retrovirus-related pol polyprotein from transposon TNT 1-94 [Tanacetum coccineum]
MASRGGRNNLVARRVIDDLIDISGQRLPLKYLKIFIEQQIIDHLRFIARMRDEIRTSTNLISQLNALITELEASSDYEDVFDLVMELQDNKRDEQDKVADFNRLIAVAEEKIHGKEIDLEMLEAEGNDGYQSEEYFYEVQEDDENNHSNGNVVKKGITRLYKFRREYGKPDGIKLSKKVDSEARDKLWDEITVKSAAAKMVRSKSVYQHTMGRGGYALVKEKMKETEDKIKEGTLKVDHGTNAMTVVLGKENGGYGRGVGSGVTYKRYFDFPRSRQASDETILLLQRQLYNQRRERQGKELLIQNLSNKTSQTEGMGTKLKNQLATQGGVLIDESQVLLRVPRKNNMYSVDLKNIVPKRGLTCLFVKATSDESKLWHRRLGHLNFKTMNKLVKGNLVRGLPSKIFENDQTCVACQKGKQHRASCKSKTENSISLPLHLLHMDLFGPTFVKSLMKKMYCLVVTDDYSRFTWVFFLATKDETSGILKSFITGIENLVDHKVKVIRCDNGTEFKNREMNQFCEMKGILRQFSVARTPQQNGVAERRNRTLIEAARTMLADSKLPTTFWAEAVNTACYVQNRVLVVKPHNKTPYELFHGRTPTLSFMRPFGCPVTILNTIDHLGKFDGKADEGFFVGYSLNSKAFRVFNSRTRIVEENLHIRFSESTPNVVGSGPDWLFDIDALTRTMNYEPIVAGTQSNGFAGTKASDNAGQARKETEPVKNYILLPLWTIDPPFSQDPKSSQDDGSKPSSAMMRNEGLFNKSSSPNPTTRIHKDHPLDQVIGDLQSTTQIRRMSKNLEEHGFVSTIQQRTNHTDLQNCLFGCFLSQEEPKKIIHALKDPSWIEAIQKELLQFKLQEVWTLVDLPNGKRAIGTKWVFKNKKDERGIMIRNKARLIEEELYVCQPPGFEDLDFPDRVYKVEKALYGLHQAPRAWYETLSTYMLDNDFQRGKIDKTLFIKRYKGDILRVQVYVDDIIFGSTEKELCNAFEKLMHEKFQMSSMGELTFFLGLQVQQKKDGIFISQDKYVEEILKKFGFTAVKTASTPMETQKPLLKDEDGEEVDVHMYRSMIGLLMYLTYSRPDIMFAVYASARYHVNPKVSHLHAVKRIFRYLKGQTKLGLWYPKDSLFDLVAYTDSDYAGASLDRKSTKGGCQFLRCRLMSWQCKKQTVIANSITEAEYVAASSCYG